MVNVEARRRYAQLLRQFRGGRITNDELEDRKPWRTGDAAIDQVFWTVWLLYDDISEDYFVPRGNAVELLDTCADFLDTDVGEYAWPVPNRLLQVLWIPFALLTLGQLNSVVWRRYQVPAHWPFASAEAREAARFRTER